MLPTLIAIAALLLVFAFPYLLATWNLRHTSMRCMHIVPVKTKDVPEQFKALFKQAIAELKPHGFKMASCHQIEMGAETDGIRWGVLLNQPSGHTWVGLMTQPPVSGNLLLTLLVMTFFEDGTQLCTINSPHWAVYSPNPQEISQYVGSHDLNAEAIAHQWQTHQEKLKELLSSKSPRAMDPIGLIEYLEKHNNDGIERLVRTKEVLWVEPGKIYRMTWLTSIKTIYQVTRKSKLLAAGRVSPPTTDSPTTSRIDLEIEEFHRLQKAQNVSFSQRGKHWLLLGTLALFVASYASIFDPITLVIFVAVLLLHEGGHVLAMKVFGYRNTMMLFIPFLGALATARKENASLTEKVWISLAGPLPGLILGIGLTIAFGMPALSDPRAATWFADTHWIREISWTLIILNLFNLLPIYPLDGGQVADLLLFSRHPYLGVAFKGLGVALLALLGLTQPLMLVFAVLIAITLPASFRLAKLNMRFRKDLRQLPVDDRDGALRFLFTQLQEPAYGSLTFAQKYGLVVGLLDTRQEDTAKWTVRLGLATIYLLSVLGGLAGLIYAMFPSWEVLSATMGRLVNPQVVQRHYVQQELDAVNRVLEANPQDGQTYLRRAGIHYAMKRYQEAIADSNRALLVDASHVEAVLMRGEAYLALKQYPEALGNANHALRLNPNSSAAYDLRSRTRQQMGDRQGAVADQQTAESLFEQER